MKSRATYCFKKKLALYLLRVVLVPVYILGAALFIDVLSFLLNGSGGARGIAREGSVWVAILEKLAGKCMSLKVAVRPARLSLSVDALFYVQSVEASRQRR